MIQLYQFPFSHYCEKVRWALDYKGLPYRVVNLLPGFHLKTVGKLAPKTCVPLLRDGGNIVQDSTAIIDYLDKRYPVPSLTPDSPDASRRALEWEEYLDEEIGVPLRLWFYHNCLPDRRLALGFLLEDAAWHKRPLFTLAFPKVREVMLRCMTINADTARQSEERLRAALDKLDEGLSGRRFLVEDRFSRSDLTACALLSPCCLRDSDEARAMFPAAVLRFCDEFRDRRFYRWMRDVYETYRRPRQSLQSHGSG